MLQKVHVSNAMHLSGHTRCTYPQFFCTVYIIISLHCGFLARRVEYLKSLLPKLRKCFVYIVVMAIGLYVNIIREPVRLRVCAVELYINGACCVPCSAPVFLCSKYF